MTAQEYLQSTRCVEYRRRLHQWFVSEGLMPALRRSFHTHVLRYYRRFYRPMAWRETSDPYEILVSEFMLQQTQVSRVRVKYDEFLSRFPSMDVLARAKLRSVLRVWQGLGYNSRGKRLHDLAKHVINRGDGLPTTAEELRELPGIGPATAAALMNFAFHTPTPFIETNIRRLYLDVFFHDQDQVSDTCLMPVIEYTMHRRDPRNWFYALMDYGSALVKVSGNANTRSRHYTKQAAFKGSDRQVRGHILRILGTRSRITEAALCTELQQPPDRVLRLVGVMCREGLLQKAGTYIRVA